MRAPLLESARRARARTGRFSGRARSCSHAAPA